MGKEAEIYIDDKKNILHKQYFPNISFKNVFRELSWLFLAKESGYVPIVYEKTAILCDDFKVVQMEYLDGYETLKQWKNHKSDYSESVKSALIAELVKGRYALHPNIKYHDLHLDNVMVKIDGNGQSDNDSDYRVNIRFIDPGRIEYYPGGEMWIDWIREAIIRLQLSRNELGKVLRKQKTSKKVFIDIVGNTPIVFDKYDVDIFEYIRKTDNKILEKRVCDYLSSR